VSRQPVLRRRPTLPPAAVLMPDRPPPVPGSRAGYTVTPESVTTTTRSSPRVVLRVSPLTRAAP
jgi:hypothetical protein